MKLETLTQLARLIDCQTKDKKSVCGVAVDSRLVEPGQVFFALKGAQVDGHAYLCQAASQGAAAAVVSEAYSGQDYGMSLLRVKDPLQALQALAQKIIAIRNPKIIAVTGSLGKTTTKDFIKALLQAKYRVAASPGNSNSQIGMPLSIINHTEGDEEVLVLEMGMTHVGNISNLLKIAPPDIALVTTVALVHACNFSSLSEIGLCKAEIFTHPKTELGILNYDIEDFEKLRHIGPCNKISFSTKSSQADYFLDMAKEKISSKNDAKEHVLSRLSVPGKHNHQNFLAAAVVARHMDISWEEIRRIMPTLTLPERRLQRIEKRRNSFHQRLL